MIEVFKAFLKLGLTSFGGPVANIGYFRRELVERRQWFSESQFSQRAAWLLLGSLALLLATLPMFAHLLQPGGLMRLLRLSTGRCTGVRWRPAPACSSSRGCHRWSWWPGACSPQW